MDDEQGSVTPEPENQGVDEGTGSEPSSGSETGDAVAQDPAPQGTESQPSTPPQPQVNWENAFKGLQGTVQREIENRRQAEERAQNLEQQAVQAHIQHLPYEQQQQYLQQYQAYRQQQDQQKQVQQQQQQIQQERTSLNEMARNFALQQVSQNYRIPYEDIAHIQDPNALQVITNTVERERKRLQNESRQQSKQDDFGGTPQSTANTGKPKFNSIDEASAWLASAKLDE